MKPIHTRYTTDVLHAHNRWDEAAHGLCTGLPVCVTSDPYIYSWWRATWRERLALLLGKPIRLCIVGLSHPPVSIDVEPRTNGGGIR
jgi:hypothetical protein